MAIFLIVLVLGGVLSVLFAASLYYGFGAAQLMAEALVTVVVLAIYWIWHAVGPGRKSVVAEKSRRREENMELFKDKPIVLNDGRTIQPGQYEFDENGLPKLDGL